MAASLSLDGEMEMPPEPDAEVAGATNVGSGERSLALLQEGNARFASGEPMRPHLSNERRAMLTEGQEPFAIVFGCVDSRVTPEVVFDRGLGDLLVIRTAGQAVDDAVLGSAEFGAVTHGIPLLVVLGHEQCGAVIATIEALEAGTPAGGNMATIVAAVAPAVESSSGDGDEHLDRAIQANIRNGVEGLRKSHILRELEVEGRLAIVGAHYILGSGVVDFMADR